MEGENSQQSISLGEAAGLFLAKLTQEEGRVSQQEVYRFVRWYGWERPFTALAASEVANYAERLSSSDTDYARKLELLRAFLVCAKKEGWSKNSLATHLKTRKGKARLPESGVPGLSETLTQQGYDELKDELDTLKSRRIQAIEEMQRAAADKDFRENAPLEAARELHGQIEGRIRELEATLKSATIIDGRQEVSIKVGVGDSVVVRDLDFDEELHYTIVSPREVDPGRGRVSSASPLGKAIIGHCQGEIIEVEAPAGRLRYRVEQVKR